MAKPKSDLRKAASCFWFINSVLEVVSWKFPIKVLEGHRGKERQDRYHKTGRSQLKWPHGLHNKKPSWAVDVVQLPLRWPPDLTKEQKKIVKAWGRWYRFCGFMEGVAHTLKILWRLKGKWRGGHDWNADGELVDQKFDDLAHHQYKPGGTDAENI